MNKNFLKAEEQAQQCAIDFLRNNQVSEEKINQIRLVHPVTAEDLNNEGLIPFYIFSGFGKGFVIVSGDYRAYEILAYSFDSNLDANKLPPNMKYWTEQYTQQIKNI